MSYRARFTVGHFIMLMRWPVLFALSTATILQIFAAFTPMLKPEQLNLPDLVPPINTAVLTLLWWRIIQLEKSNEYFRDRMDRFANHQGTQDRRAGQPRRLRRGEEPPQAADED